MVSCLNTTSVFHVLLYVPSKCRQLYDDHRLSSTATNNQALRFKSNLETPFYVFVCEDLGYTQSGPVDFAYVVSQLIEVVNVAMVDQAFRVLSSSLFPQWSGIGILNLLPSPLLFQYLTLDPPRTLFKMFSLHLRRSSGSLDHLSDSPSSFPQRKIGILLCSCANVLRSHSTLWSAVHLTFRNEGMTMDEEVRIAVSSLVKLA
ncbi:hypothetical protein GYMLUDRAFT_241053 [Collybiopsis luxurians FD-317 M1]|nr:hypothetical protein GYMLUDRAFT_241053 [Collybiopsis luxurians FD-317 M1]